MPRYAIITLTLLLNALLQFTVAEINHHLSPLGLALHLQTLGILFAGLYLRILHGALLALVLGALADAVGPHDFGPLAFLHLLLWTGAVFMRARIRRDVPFQVRATALLLQSAALAYLTLFSAYAFWTLPAFWLRLLLDSLLSLIILATLATPWLNLQIRLLEAFSWEIRSERVDA